MNFYWVYDIPNWLFGLLVLTAVVGFSVVGLHRTRGWARRRIGEAPAANEIVDSYLAAVGVFYGITLGLISVGTWENFSEVEKACGQEAGALAALYRDISSYPEPARAALRGRLREYTRYVIQDSWPQQQRGIVPRGEAERLDVFEQSLLAFEPQTGGQQTLHQESVRQFNRLIELRDARLQSVTTGLSGVLWGVVFTGAILNIVLTWLIVMDRVWLHLLLTAILSALVALLIFMVAAMDHPYRGEYSVSPEPFRIVYDQLMKPD